MAKLKKTIEERQALKLLRQDAELLKRYAWHCYQEARFQKAKEKLLTVAAIVPTEGKRHRDVLKQSEKAIREWFNGLGPMKERARIKIRAELALGYTSGSVSESQAEE